MQVFFRKLGVARFGKSIQCQPQWIDFLNLHFCTRSAQTFSEFTDCLLVKILWQLSRAPGLLRTEPLQQLSAVVLAVWNLQIPQKCNLHVEVAQSASLFS